VIGLLLALLLQSQTPLPASKDARGLLAINGDFYELAARSGGDFYFWSAGEFASSHVEIPIQGEEVLLAYGSAGGRRTFDIPVHSGVKSLTVFAGAQRKDLATLVRPDGTVARHREAGVAVQTFQHMMIAAVESPAPGTWRLELDAQGLYSVSAHVRTDAAQLTSAEFVERRGRPGHEGLFPVERPPSAGATALCRIRFDGASDAQVAFYRRDGTLIASKPPGADGITSCEVPHEPFRFGVIARDASGYLVQRMDRPLREP
jgi:von Willebrand factor A domain-containing protein 7